MDRVAFWNDFAARYDTHRGSREALALAPRIADDLGDVGRVLDIGAGTGNNAIAIAPSAREVVAADFSEEMLAVARRKVDAAGLDNVSTVVADGAALPFERASFDAVLLVNVLHVVERPSAVLTEARRVLRPEGRLLAPTYLHGEGLRARLLSYLATALFRLPVRHRWSAATLSRLVEQHDLSVVRREIMRFSLPLLYLDARPWAQ